MIDQLFQDIAPARALQISVSRHWKNGIELSAPLGPNLNDKGTAFAGSISSILTLAGWALMTLELKQAEICAEVMVVKSECNYTDAIRSDLKAEATVAGSEMTRVFQELEARGRSRIRIQSTLPGCAAMTASYAIIKAGS